MEFKSNIYHCYTTTTTTIIIIIIITY
jgi:hypothetical protein